MAKAARFLRQARRRADLTQRDLAERLGVPQSQIAKIESGAVVPRVDTLDRFLRACGETLEPMPLLGIGIDRSGFREAFKRTPRERLQEAARWSAGMRRLREAARR
jgi:transcriptional regulator with XRE-family HTH domain